jgi:hypothetical protein
MNALGIKFPPLIYLVYLALCLFLIMQSSVKREVGIGFLIGGTIMMAIWSHVKHRNKNE